MTANPERGEVALVLPPKEEGGEPRSYTLKLSMNAAVLLEARLKRKVGEILGDAAMLSFTSIRDIVWLLVQKHHSDVFKDNEEGRKRVGDLIDDAGGVKAFFDTLQQLGALNTPEDKGGSGSRPQKTALDGVGDDSTSKPAPLM